MTDATVSHEDAVNAVRKALVDTAEALYQSTTADELLKAAQAYELVLRSEY